METPLRQELRWLRRWVRPYRWGLALLLLLFLLGAALGLAYPLIVRDLIDRVFQTRDADRLVVALGLLLGLSVAQILVAQFATYRYSRLAGRIVLDLRHALFRHLGRLPLEFYAARRAGDIASRIGGDIGEVQGAATGSLLSVATSVLTLAASIGVLLYLDRTLFLVSLLILPPSAFLAHRFSRPVRDASRHIREENANLGSTFFDSVLGQHFVRAHGLETRSARRFFRDGRAVFDSVLRLSWITAWSQGLNGFVATISSLLVLGVGGFRVIQDEMSLGTLLAFQMYVSGLHGPLQGLATLYLRLQRSRVSIRRIMEIFALPPLPRGGNRAADEIRGDVRVERVSFAYDARHPVLEDVSLHVEPGRRLAIAGPSGIGKSTLLDLVVGLREPGAGVVSIDGHPVREYRPASLRRQIGVVSQEVFLFHASIRENLQLVDLRADDRKLWEALEVSGLRAWVEALPDGLETVVGERALRLSGGQRQRLALARAIVRRPRLLILDEATSSLDEITDRQVRLALEHFLRDATTLVATHRESVIADADHAVLLDAGRIVFEGAPREVLRFVADRVPRDAGVDRASRPPAAPANGAPAGPSRGRGPGPTREQAAEPTPAPSDRSAG
jgi:ATP-binding cassette subfamily B protein